MKTKTIKPKTKVSRKPKTKVSRKPKTKSPKTKTKVSRKPKTKTTKSKVSRKPKTIKLENKEQEPVMNINTMIKQNFESQQPLVLYSKNKETGQETLLEAQKTEKDGMKSLVVKAESKIPPTIISDNFGKSMMTMNQKRQLVVQSFSTRK